MTNTPEGCPKCQYPIARSTNPPVSMSGPGLKELPHRVGELLKHHESSRELGFEVLEQELHALFTHAECACDERGAGPRRCGHCPMCSSTGRSITGRTGSRRSIAARWARWRRCARYIGRVRASGRSLRWMPKMGIVEGYWTPHAARQGAMLTAHLVPREAEEVLGVLGNMTPSKSSLDRSAQVRSRRVGRRNAPSSWRVCARTRSRSRPRRAPSRCPLTG